MDGQPGVIQSRPRGGELRLDPALAIDQPAHG
jgi:hypothetical protein